MERTINIRKDIVEIINVKVYIQTVLFLHSAISAFTINEDKILKGNAYESEPIYTEAKRSIRDQIFKYATRETSTQRY